MIESLSSSQFNRIAWELEDDAGHSIAVDNDIQSIYIQKENGELVHLHSNISDVISYLFRSAIILQRQDIIESCTPFLDKLTLFANAVPAYLKYYDLWPKVIDLVEKSGAISTSHLYKKLGANGLTLRPLLNTAEYINLIKIENNVISLKIT